MDIYNTRNTKLVQSRTQRLQSGKQNAKKKGQPNADINNIPNMLFKRGSGYNNVDVHAPLNNLKIKSKKLS